MMTASARRWRLDPHFMQRHFLVSLQQVREGRIHTILTSCFSHKDGLHLLANMVTLYFMWNKYLFPSGRLVRRSSTCHS